MSETIITGFMKYPKIRRVGDVSIKDILFRKIDFITEKLDGFNVSIWKLDDTIHIGKRNSELSLESTKGFEEFAKWVKESNWDFLPNNTTFYGEGLRGKETTKDVYKRTGKINYEVKEPFVMFNIFYEGEWIKPESDFWNEMIEAYKKHNPDKTLHCVPVLARNIKLSYDKLKDYLGESVYSPNVTKEGIVLSIYEEEGEVTMGKFVADEFQELKRRKKPRGSNYDELVFSVVTKARVEKLMRKHEIKDIKDFGKLIGAVSEDVFDEEGEYLKEHAWKLFKKDFGSRIPRMLLPMFDEIRNEANENDKEE